MNVLHRTTRGVQFVIPEVLVGPHKITHVHPGEPNTQTQLPDVGTSECERQRLRGSCGPIERDRQDGIVRVALHHRDETHMEPEKSVSVHTAQIGRWQQDQRFCLLMGGEHLDHVTRSGEQRVSRRQVSYTESRASALDRSVPEPEDEGNNHLKQGNRNALEIEEILII